MRVKTSIAVSMLLCATAFQAMAAVEVEFVKPENFVDVGSRWVGSRPYEDGLKNVRAALIERGEAILEPGQDMKIVVTDVNLAGKIYPDQPGGQKVRQIKPMFAPSMEFRYVITESGKPVREGTVSLTDPSFMTRYNRYFRDDMLRFEKPMLDDWFSNEFGKDVKVARR